MDKKRRNDISRCLKQNYNIRLGEIDKFIELNRRTIERHNNEVISSKVWIDIFNVCKKNNSGEIFTIYNAQKAIVSIFLVWDNKRGYYLGSGANDNSGCAMSLLMWNVIKYTKEKLGLNEFDFTGSDSRGLEFFIRKFGGDIRPFFYVSENSIRKVIISKSMNLYRGLKKGKQVETLCVDLYKSCRNIIQSRCVK